MIGAYHKKNGRKQDMNCFRPINVTSYLNLMNARTLD